MKYKATITVDTGDLTEKAYKCFVPEEKVKTDRSNLKLIKSKNNIIFEITAKDAVALKATFMSLSKLLTVFEKVKNGR